MIVTLGKIEEKRVYILFKDYKRIFLDKKQARLINLTKTEQGFIAKDLIQRIMFRLPSGHNVEILLRNW